MTTRHFKIVNLLLALTILAFGTTIGKAQVSFDWVTVGNLGNLPDSLNSGTVAGIGSVSYSYNISSTEVNLFQYAAFLNAVDPTGLNQFELYHSSMGSALNIAGISYDAVAANGSKYAVIGNGLRPITFVSWNDAARFVNWLQNGQGGGSTETGVYTMSLGMPIRSTTATYWIPSENEWYKAAYHDPGLDGPEDDYWLYPTRSDSVPGNTIGDSANQANYFEDDYSVTQSSFHSHLQNYLTDGGSYGNSASFYGTYDQGGNVWEWNDTIIAGSSRGLRGGSWDDGFGALLSSSRGYENPAFQLNLLGFRVASVPEPSTPALIIFVAIACWILRRRKIGA